MRPYQSSAASYGHRRRSGLRGWKRVLLIVALVIVGLCVVVRFVASPIAKSVINKKLAALPGYTGRVETVKLWLWRGGGEIENFVLYERGHEDDIPVVHAKRAGLVVALRGLLRGKLGGNATAEEVEVTVIKRHATPKKGESDGKQKKDEDKQAKGEKVEEKKEEVRRWQETLEEAFPMEITRLELSRGKVRFLDRSVQPQVDIALSDLQVLGTNLGNRPEPEDGPMPAKVELTGTTTGNGRLRVSVQADPLAKQPQFKTEMELLGMDLPALNSFLLAYANADVARGTFEIFTEVNAADGAYEGYVKPFFKDLDFKTASDKDKNAAQLLMKKAVSAVTSVLKNDETNQVATKTPFAGNFTDNKVGVWTTIQNLLRNAFVQALRGGFEGQPPPKANAAAAPTPG
ncbi:MAG TPA: DUF748 domain-containing protein [Opitutaceae bacterium]|nr:DUF748 domain-containing protein [Opitutaceae bacterium]